MSNGTIISNYLFGWDHLESIILGCIATKQNILLLGSHGTGKTSIGKFLSVAAGIDEKEFMKYAMDKENLLSMVGCPNPEKLREGKLDYATHERSVFRAKAMLMDEITRSPKDTQNMVLEILEEKTVFGKPLKYKFCIASANNETYKGAMKLDAALLDRFVVVLPVPSPNNQKGIFGAEEIKAMIELNLWKRKKNLEATNTRLRAAIIGIKKTYKNLWQNKEAVTNLVDFTSKFFSILLTQLKEYKSNVKDIGQLSYRQISDHFCKLSFAIAAYYKFVKNNNDECFLQKAVWDAIKYSLSTKLGLPLEKLEIIYDDLKDLLVDGDSLVAKIKIAVNTGNVTSRVTAIEKYITQISKHFEYDEKVSMIGEILNEANLDDPIDVLQVIKLHDILKANPLVEACEAAVLLRIFTAAQKRGTPYKKAVGL
jgi:hypothetical protein